MLGVGITKIGATLIIAGVIIAYVGVRYLRRWDEVISLEESTIDESSSQSSLVKVSGVIESIEDETIVSPLTNEPCVAYEYSVVSDQNESSEEDHILAHGERCQPFVLSDSTGRVYIAPTTDDIEFPMSEVVNTSKSDLYDIVPPDVFDEELNPQFQQGMLQQGDVVSAVGVPVQNTPTPTGSFELANRSRFVISEGDIELSDQRRFLKGVVFVLLGGGVILYQILPLL